MYFFSPTHQAATQGMRFAITYEQYRITGILNIVADMVFDPAGIRHAAGGNNDTRFIAVIEHLGLFHGLYIFQSFKRERVVVRLQNFLNGAIEVLWVFLYNLRGSDTERAVY